MALTAKQRRFVDEYLSDLNATQAAIRAGYSRKTAGAVGFENLQKPEIASAIREGQAKAAERAQITVDEIVNGLLLEARRDGEGASHSARVSAWTALGKHFGMFKERHEHSGPDGGPIEVQQKMDLSKLTDEQLANLENILAIAGGSQEGS